MALIGGNDHQDAPSGASAKRKRNERNSKASPASAFADDPLDPMLDVKRRARRRLIGAIALVLAAIVFVPMIFDSGTKPVVDNISIQMPDKNTPFTPGKPTVVAPSPTAVIPKEPEVKEPVAEPVAAIAPPLAPEIKPVEKPAEKAAVKPAEKAAEKSTEKPTDKPAEKSAEKKPAGDDPRVVALLEGKPEVKPEAKSDVKADEEKAGSYAVQIGAFSDPAKVKFLHDKLSEGGFKTYTEVVKTTQGERTRLRIGPYAARADADKAQERVKKLFVLDATVVPLGQ